MMVRHVKQFAAEATRGLGGKQREVVAGAIGPIAEERTNDRLHESRPAHFVGIAARIRDADQRILAAVVGTEELVAWAKGPSCVTASVLRKNSTAR